MKKTFCSYSSNNINRYITTRIIMDEWETKIEKKYRWFMDVSLWKIMEVEEGKKERKKKKRKD